MLISANASGMHLHYCKCFRNALAFSIGSHVSMKALNKTDVKYNDLPNHFQPSLPVLQGSLCADKHQSFSTNHMVTRYKKSLAVAHKVRRRFNRCQQYPILGCHRRGSNSETPFSKLSPDH